MDAEIKALSDSLIYEILNALGLPKTEAFRRACRAIFHGATDRLSQIGVGFDRAVRDKSFTRAAEQTLERID